MEGQRIEFRGWRVHHQDRTIYWVDQTENFYDVKTVFTFLPEAHANSILALETLHANIDQ